MFKLLKLFVLLAMVVWVAAAVSAMTSGAMGMMKRKKWMKHQLREKMPEMRARMNEEMSKAEERLD